MENSQHQKSQSKCPNIKIFQIIQKNLASIGIGPNSAKEWHPFPFNVKSFLIFLTLAAATISNLIYISTSVQTFAEYSQSAYTCSVVILMTIVLLTLIYQSNELFKMINDGECIANTTLKYSPSKSIFVDTNQRVEKLCEILFFFIVHITPACCLLPWFFYSFFNCFNTGFDRDAFVLQSPMWFPFDWKTPFGYFIAISIQYIMFAYALLVGGCATVLGIGIYFFSMAMSKIINGSLFSIDRNTKVKTKRKRISKKLIEILEFHSNVKKFMSHVSEVMEYYLAIMFVWCLLTICGAFLMVQNELVHHDDNFAALLIIIIEIIYAFGLLLLDCEICQRVNQAFGECSDMFDQFDWYLFPDEIRRMMSIILLFTQQEIEINCFGRTPCNRETFKYVIKTAWSYFTTLRQFYS